MTVKLISADYTFTEFGKINIGDLFRYDSITYMKIAGGNKAVDLSTGKTKTFTIDHFVNVITGSVLIYNY